MKKVVSYALFGKQTRYADYARAVVRAHHALFPLTDGWVLRVHHDDYLDTTSYGPQLRRLDACGLVGLVPVIPRDAPLCQGMISRMQPLWDDTVDVVFCRDMDALPTPRDRAACDAFIGSDAAVQTVLDNPYHCGIMGGLCGFKREAFWKAVGDESEETPLQLGSRDWTIKGADQDALNTLVKLYNMRVLEQRSPSKMAGNIDASKYVEAEMLAPHLGCAGFNVEKAVAFYDSLGLDIIEQIGKAERQ